MNRKARRGRSRHSVLGCPQAESRINTPPGPASSRSRSRLWAISDTSAALPGSGRTYSDTPSALAACSARTWRPTPCPAPSPLATSAEPSYAPQTRSAVRSTCSRPASIPNRSIARAASVPRSVSAYTARISSARPSRSSFNNAGGDPQQLLQRRARRPPGDVIQRRGRAQAAADQRRDRLPDRQLLAPALRQRPIDRRRSDQAAVMKCQANSSGPTSRRTPAIGGSNRANEPISCSSWPDALSSSSRPSVLARDDAPAPARRDTPAPAADTHSACGPGRTA